MPFPREKLTLIVVVTRYLIAICLWAAAAITVLAGGYLGGVAIYKLWQFIWG